MSTSVPVHVEHDFFTNFRLVGKLIGANMNVTTDQLIFLSPQAELFKLVHIRVTNASVSLTTAAGGVYLQASKGGTPVVANTQVYTALTATSKFLDLTLAGSALTDLIDPTVQTDLYFSLTTPQGAAATADIYVYAETLQGRAGE